MILSNCEVINMKVLMINGSPRNNSCTLTALNEVAKALYSHDIESHIVSIGTAAIRGCIACNKCIKTGYCIFRDDAINEWVDLMKECDGLIVGSPVYYAAPNPSLCAALDRMFYYKSDPYAFKPGAAIVSCRRAGSTAALDCLNKFFTIAQMPIVSSQYWNMVHGNAPEEVAQDLEGLQTMRVLGNNMAWLLKCLEATKDSIPKPKQEERFWTNFVR